jgi:16S rRNA G966 N2-methylase RsmD
MTGARSKFEHVCSYAGDGPHPALRAFVQRSAAPFDPGADDYERGPFARTIRTTKQSPIYALHGYHLGKKPHDAIRAYIAHYTSVGDLVLDPFAGSGSTALAALQENRHAIAIDASPAATFIARYYLSPIDAVDLRERFEAMVETVREEMAWLYGTTCHRCGGAATLHHVIYANTYPCPVCGDVVSLFEATHAGKPPCCPRCRGRGCEVPISPLLGVVGCVPVAVSFSCLGSCKPSRFGRSICGAPAEIDAFERIDRAGIEALDRMPIPHPVPDAAMMHVQNEGAPWGDEWRPSRNFRRIRDLFTHRNLWALAALRCAAGEDLDLQAVLTSGMLAVSRKAQHLDGGGGYIPGNWALPPMTKQRNVLESVRRVFRRSLVAREQLVRLRLRGQACLSTQSAMDLGAIPDASIDYVFTDPPYGGVVQYAELNFLWEAWLGFDTGWHEREIVVNRTRGLTLETWTMRMTRALSECHRVLKPGRWLSICYHDVSRGSWGALQQAASDAGFVHESAAGPVAIDTGGRTYNQYTVDKSTKRDLVLSFRKPRGTVVARPSPVVDDQAYFEHVRDIISAYLRENPGSSRDRIYDDLVANLVREGQMREHDFDRELLEVAEARGELGRVVRTGVRKGAHTARWFLRPVPVSGT